MSPIDVYWSPHAVGPSHAGTLKCYIIISYMYYSVKEGDFLALDLNHVSEEMSHWIMSSVFSVKYWTVVCDFFHKCWRATKKKGEVRFPLWSWIWDVLLPTSSSGPVKWYSIIHSGNQRAIKAWNDTAEKRRGACFNKWGVWEERSQLCGSLSLHLCVSEDTGSERRQSFECMSTGMTQHLRFPCGQRGRRCTNTLTPKPYWVQILQIWKQLEVN